MSQKILNHMFLDPGLVVNLSTKAIQLIAIKVPLLFPAPTFKAKQTAPYD